MAVTLKQIAARSGLSLVTVSYVLNDKGHLFRPATRARVIEAAEALGYRPNSSAKAVRQGRFNSIALVLSDQRYRSALSNTLLSGIQDVLIRHDLHLTVTEIAERNLDDANFVPKILRESMSDGLLINYFQDAPSQLKELIERYQFPAVWVNVKRDADCVHPDDVGAGRMATAQLLKLGHKRIAYCDGVHNFDPNDPRQDHYSAADRLEGYLSEMYGAGLTPRLLIEKKNLKTAEITDRATRWLTEANRPTAIVSYGPREMLGIVIAAERLGLKIPRDLSLISINSEFMDFGVPLTTVLLDDRQLGAEATRMLLEKIAEPDRPLPSRVLAVSMSENVSCRAPAS